MNTPSRPPSISPVQDIVAEMRAGRIVILVDEEDRENETIWSSPPTMSRPEAINPMARYGRGLICLTLASAASACNCRPWWRATAPRWATAFTVSIEAAEGVTTGISAADRARTVQTAVAPNAQAADLVQPGHLPLQAVDGGVLMRAGHPKPAATWPPWLAAAVFRDLRGHEGRRHHGAACPTCSCLPPSMA